MSRDKPDWRDAAACRAHDPELFFPDDDQRAARTQTDQARQVCRSCAVSDACLEFATLTGISDGVWGGLTADDRRARWRHRRRATWTTLPRNAP